MSYMYDTRKQKSVRHKKVEGKKFLAMLTLAVKKGPIHFVTTSLELRPCKINTLKAQSSAGLHVGQRVLSKIGKTDFSRPDLGK